MTLLSMISNAVLRQNQTPIYAVIGSSDQSVMQRQAMLQDVGDELSERYTWQNLNTSGSIVCDGASTLYPLPANWGGLSEGTTLQSTLYPTLPVIGPVSNEQMAAFKAFPVQPLQPVWRIIGNQFEFYPAPALGEIYAYNYYSTYWICNVGNVSAVSVANGGAGGTDGTAVLTLNGGAVTPYYTGSTITQITATISGGVLTSITSVSPGYYTTLPPSPAFVTGANLVGAQVNLTTTASPIYKASFTSDSDVSLIDEKLLTTGLEWRWLKSKGLDYGEEFRRFEMRLDRIRGRDDKIKIVSTSNRISSGFQTLPILFPLYDGNGTNGTDLSYT